MFKLATFLNELNKTFKTSSVTSTINVSLFGEDRKELRLGVFEIHNHKGENLYEKGVCLAFTIPKNGEPIFALFENRKVSHNVYFFSNSKFYAPNEASLYECIPLMEMIENVSFFIFGFNTLHWKNCYTPTIKKDELIPNFNSNLNLNWLYGKFKNFIDFYQSHEYLGYLEYIGETNRNIQYLKSLKICPQSLIPKLHKEIETSNPQHYSDYLIKGGVFEKMISKGCENPFRSQYKYKKWTKKFKDIAQSVLDCYRSGQSASFDSLITAEVNQYQSEEIDEKINGLFKNRDDSFDFLKSILFTTDHLYAYDGRIFQNSSNFSLRHIDNISPNIDTLSPEKLFINMVKPFHIGMTRLQGKSFYLNGITFGNINRDTVLSDFGFNSKISYFAINDKNEIVFPVLNSIRFYQDLEPNYPLLQKDIDVNIPPSNSSMLENLSSFIDGFLEIKKDYLFLKDKVKLAKSEFI